MRREDLPKLLKIDDAGTHLTAYLPTTATQAGGVDTTLEFRFSDAGLLFRAKHYHGYADVFHGYDDDIYTDAAVYLEAITAVREHRRDWADLIRSRLHNSWLQARCKPGQPVRVFATDVQTITGEPGFIKKADDEFQDIVVTYRSGRQVTAKMKKTVRNLYHFFGRDGTRVQLGGTPTQEKS